MEHLDSLRLEGARLAAVAAATPLDAAVPSCPGWDVGTLVRHLGNVHLWAACIVRERLPARPSRDDALGPTGRDELVGWYRHSLNALVDVLGAATPDVTCWTFAPAPSAVAFWTRRQAHETAIHRLDVEQAAGVATPTPARAAADGIDEWLTIAERRVKVPGGGGRMLAVSSTDTDDRWHVALAEDGLVLRESGGDCTVAGTASDMFALLMNRRTDEGLHARGDMDVLRVWRESVRFL